MKWDEDRRALATAEAESRRRTKAAEILQCAIRGILARRTASALRASAASAAAAREPEAQEPAKRVAAKDAAPAGTSDDQLLAAAIAKADSERQQMVEFAKTCDDDARQNDTIVDKPGGERECNLAAACSSTAAGSLSSKERKRAMGKMRSQIIEMERLCLQGEAAGKDCRAAHCAIRAKKEQWEQLAGLGQRQNSLTGEHLADLEQR